MLNNKFMLIIIVVLFAFSLLVGGDLPFFLLYFFISILILSLIEIFYFKRCINVNLISNKATVYAGDKVEISYEISNKGKFSIPYVEVEDLFENKLTNKPSKPIIYSLEPKQTLSKKTIISVKRRGRYDLSEIKINLMDNLGIFKFTKLTSQNASIIVYPTYRKLESFKIYAGLSAGELLAFDKVSENRNRINGIRKYVVGDPIKSIHWKLSAKKDTLITKEYENRKDTSVFIILDSLKSKFINDFEFHLEDLQVEIASSIIEYCLSHEIEVALFYEAKSENVIIQGKNIHEFNPFRDKLAVYEPNGVFEFNYNIAFIDQYLYKFSTIIYVTTYLSKSDAKELLTLKMNGFNPIILLITDVENKSLKFDYYYVDKLRLQSMTIYELDYNSDIVKKLEAQYER